MKNISKLYRTASFALLMTMSPLNAVVAFGQTVPGPPAPQGPNNFEDLSQGTQPPPPPAPSVPMVPLVDPALTAEALSRPASDPTAVIPGTVKNSVAHNSCRRYVETLLNTGHTLEWQDRMLQGGMVWHHADSSFWRSVGDTAALGAGAGATIGLLTSVVGILPGGVFGGLLGAITGVVRYLTQSDADREENKRMQEERESMRSCIASAKAAGMTVNIATTVNGPSANAGVADGSPTDRTNSGIVAPQQRPANSGTTPSGQIDGPGSVSPGSG